LPAWQRIWNTFLFFWLAARAVFCRAVSFFSLLLLTYSEVINSNSQRKKVAKKESITDDDGFPSIVLLSLLAISAIP
jgi:hypothetical protein